MALFGGERDVSLFRHLNRELVGDIINQQCAFYKFQLKETNTNLYGESSEEKYYLGPVLINCLIKRDTPGYSSTDLGTDFNWKIEFRFLRDDLLDKNKEFNIDTEIYGANLVPQVGDIIFYQESYYETHNVIENQYFAGKNPQYPNSPNTLNPGLDEFGSSISIVCQTHQVPADKVGITRERLL